MEILLPKDPAKYETFMEQMDEALDIVDIDHNLMYDHVQEDHEKTEYTGKKSCQKTAAGHVPVAVFSTTQNNFRFLRICSCFNTFEHL